MWIIWGHTVCASSRMTGDMMHIVYAIFYFEIGSPSRILILQIFCCWHWLLGAHFWTSWNSNQTQLLEIMLLKFACASLKSNSYSSCAQLQPFSYFFNVLLWPSFMWIEMATGLGQPKTAQDRFGQSRLMTSLAQLGSARSRQTTEPSTRCSEP